MTNKREKNLDVLRVLATFLVVLLHVSSNYVAVNVKSPNMHFTVGNFFEAITRIGVPIFVMLSGAFILDNTKNKEYKKFYKKTFKKIIIPTLIWSLVYFLYSIGLEFGREIFLGKKIDIGGLIVLWLKGAPFDHLWYMYMIMGLYAVTPILIRLKEDIGEKNTLRLGIGLTFFGMLIYHTSSLFWPVLFIDYMGYFILGYALKKYYILNPKRPFKYILGAIISALLVFSLTEGMARMGWGTNKLYFYGNLTPFVMAGAICVFIAFINMKDIKLNMEGLVKHSFNIYLIHAGILSVINLLINNVFNWTPNPIWYIPVMAVIVFYISYVGSLIIFYFIELLGVKKKKSKLKV